MLKSVFFFFLSFAVFCLNTNFFISLHFIGKYLGCYMRAPGILSADGEGVSCCSYWVCTQHNWMSDLLAY